MSKYVTLPEVIEQIGITEHKMRRIARAGWHGFPSSVGTRTLKNGYKAAIYKADLVQLWIDNNPSVATRRINFNETEDYHPQLCNKTAGWFIRCFPRPDWPLLLINL